MASTNPQRWARCPPGLAWKRPGLPTEWTRVLVEHPEGAKALPGYVWLDTPGKVRRTAELAVADGLEPEYQAALTTLTAYVEALQTATESPAASVVVSCADDLDGRLTFECTLAH
jgi:hypothetical protein